MSLSFFASGFLRSSLRRTKPSTITRRAFSVINTRSSFALFDVEDDHIVPLPKMSTPGLMFVSSRVLDPTKTSDEKYNRFYNDEHLPDVLGYNVTKLALRYKNTAKETDRPYIALYPLDDVNYLHSEALGKLIEDTKISKTFDNTDIYAHLAFDLRPYTKIQTYEGYGLEDKSGKERGQTLVCVAMQPAEGEEQDFEDWYRKQHLDMLAMCRGYRRTTRYKRIDGKTPQFLALHEYACAPTELPAEQTKQVVSSEWSKKIIGEAKAFDRDVFELIQAQGDTSLKL
jgi:hypothetical protein